MIARHPPIYAHRGFSSRQPEMTVAAYRAAIDWAVAERWPLVLECDVHFSADDQLICLHDLRVDRTSDGTGMAFDLTVDQLRQLDFGSWKVPNPRREQRMLTTLGELMAMVAQARENGAPVELAIETKHPNPRGLAVEERVATMLTEYGWQHSPSPVRVISFSVDGIEAAGRLLPELERTLLIEHDLGPWVDGHLPDGVNAVGPDLALVKKDPDFVARAHAHGNEVHVWTVNEPADIKLCLFLGVDGFTTDYPERVAEILEIFALSPPTQHLPG
ncbi:MAG TPA: glycerophosphodiester phosphodiesterase family protein [Propionibacteriaceae bacterium]|nr:glycerophosphodiester phosphodiesterase family protein [Propionibacteriaceae bacterium]